jgi:RNA polymerase sigma-70 factor (ECF subfamily)
MQARMAMEHQGLPLDERRLIERARGGDIDAYDAIVLPRLGPTYRLVKAIVGHADDADDVTQEAFVQAWRALPQLRDADRFDAWFGRVVVNTARMHLRRRDRVMTVSVTSIELSGDGAPQQTDVALDSIAGSDALQAAIDRLSADQRSILALHHLEERPVKDIAAILGTPVGTVKWRLHEAREALRRAMESES